jgi:signal recognition particle subunit SRP68
LRRCLAIARSHSILSEHKNALALLARASDLSSAALPLLKSLAAASASSPPSISISPSEAQFLHDLVHAELQRHRALVEISNLTRKSEANETPGSGLPLIDRLNTYPPNGEVDLTNLVTYPPKLEPIPVKPLFLDVAWNYIDYPERAATKSTASVVKPPAEAPKKEQEQPALQQKKGWFGFGR